jgi:hydroxymethylpyrimidine/phosphomethylpyrimidine kinase
LKSAIDELIYSLIWFKFTVKEAVETAVAYVAAALENSIGVIGSGAGPLNHFHNVVAKPYAGYVMCLYL